MKWKIATISICFFIFFKDFRPSESYITAYLMAPEWKNLTAEQVNNEVYPVWVYTNLVCLLIILLVTDFLRYKIIIVIAALCYVATWFLLLFGEGVPQMQLMQGTFGFATASQVAHTSYIFSSVDPKYFRQISSYIHSSSLVSRFCAACLAQLLVSLVKTNYFVLNIISTASVCIALVISLALPRVSTSFYFTPNPKSPNQNNYLKNSKGNVNEEEIQKLNCGNSKIDEDITSEGTKSEKPKIPEKEPDSVLFKPGTEKEFDQHSLGSVPEDVSKSEAVEIVINDTQPKKLADTNTIKDRFKAGLRQMWNDFQKAYKNQRNLMWSFWWVVVVCGKTHIGNYIQSLYEDIVPNPMSDMSYNAAIDAAALATCAASSFGVGFLKIEWNSYENVLLFSVNVIISCLMIVMALATKIWLAYMCYIIIRISYHTVLTIATYQIATFLDTQSYALVFGFNTFLALVLETTLTIIVVDKRGLNLDIRTQFIVYGGYFGVLALPFLARMLYCFFVKRRSMAFKNENT
ncbi:folate transporter 1-like isoform X1 [Octopus vulgaris]|uniref:Folate transporter 1-like isoform X1 n=1 Tax=Octopus vulgaris TaxID=6645 RepID=A0AA36FBY5_OCTVU|nr:folate transporter 1-like isoform X1 [Octopus vulgaris]